jgi:hypothetical protein
MTKLHDYRAVVPDTGARGEPRTNERELSQLLMSPRQAGRYARMFVPAIGGRPDQSRTRKAEPCANRSLAIGLLFSIGLAHSAWADNAATRWISHALEVVRTTNQSTQAAGRIYALTGVAMYDAVNGIERERLKSAAGPARGKIREQALVPSEGAPVLGDRRTADAAATAAAHAVLIAQFSETTNPTLRVQLDDALNADLEALGGDIPPVTAGRDWGEFVGAEVLALRSTDGTQVTESQCVVGTPPPPCTFTFDGGPGQFPRRFTNSQFRNMTPFSIQSIDPYLSSGPPPLSSTEYADAFNDVKQFGSFTDTGTPEAEERAAIGRHWQAETSTARETGLWLKAALNIVESQRTVDSLPDTVRLFALISMATADAVAVSWTNKFDYHYWRPADAIRATGTNVDGNVATVEDPTWQPRAGIGNFGGTPEHTSGSATFAGAASKVLQGFYCRDDIAFSGRQAGDAIGTEVITTSLRPEGACRGVHCACP